MRGIVHIDIGHIRAGEGAFQSRLDRAVQHKLRPDQHAVRIEQAQGQGSTAHHGWDLVHIVRRLHGAFADIDRIGRPVGRRDIMAGMIEQKHCLAGLCIFQRDPAGETRLAGHNRADNALSREDIVGLAEIGGKVFG